MLAQPKSKLVLFASFALLVACSNQGSTSSGRSSAARRGGEAFPEIPEDIERQGDFRVVLYQSQVSDPIILVNAGHRLRGTPEGRKRLALNMPGAVYKVLTESGMQALLTSLDQRGFSQSASPFVRGDERYFEAQENRDYRGMVMVERNGAFQKMLGLLGPRPSPEEQAAYQRFRDMKVLCATWYTDTSATESATQSQVMRIGSSE